MSAHEIPRSKIWLTNHKEHFSTLYFKVHSLWALGIQFPITFEAFWRSIAFILGFVFGKARTSFCRREGCFGTI